MLLSKILSILITLTAIFAFACNSKREANPAPDAENQTYKSVGIVKKVDAEKGKITIDHEDIPGYMTAMEMTEAVSDKKMLESAKTGDKVEFEIRRTGSKLLITKLSKIGEALLINAPEIFKTNCAECHGEKGEGTKKGLSFLKGHALDHTEEDFIRRVTDGKDDKMPAFKDKLTTEEIIEVVKFVRTEIQKDAKKDEKGAHHH